MKRAFALVLALVACGTKPGRWDNTVKTPRSTLAEVGAPHQSVVVHTDGGLWRVYLDTGVREQVSSAADARALDGETMLEIVEGHFEIMRAGSKRVKVEGVTAKYMPTVSPDRKHAALNEDSTLVVFDLIDGSVRRYPIEVKQPLGSNYYVAFQWAPKSDALLVKYDRYLKVDLATGVESPIDEIDYRGEESHEFSCPSHGFELQQKGQTIVLVPTASSTDPEHIASLETRVLVKATDKPGHMGDGAINLGKKNPDPLSLDLLLPSCEHFLFSLEGKTYVGNIETGKIAFLSFGWGPVL